MNRLTEAQLDEIKAIRQKLSKALERVRKESEDDYLRDASKGASAFMLRWSVPHNAKTTLGDPMPSSCSIQLSQKEAVKLVDFLQEMRKTND
jgi:hypothetical protein